ncbi:fasciclin domain-containing protein [Geofilum rubicundum]|uniref:fasciclin domain-containing protein n=1 Tax=Geofilum rubicundum TaxID=472113 RepID=UPI0009FE468F|nr:fasciclin domain-containing protein [Geofilum rubicundum]
MKSLVAIFCFCLLGLAACSDAWNQYYSDKAEDVTTSDQTLGAFLEAEEAFSDFRALLQEAGVLDELDKDQYMTVWAVNNEHFDLSGIGNLEPSHVARYHLNYLAYGENNLKAGLRIPTFNGTYITIGESGALVNESRILSSQRFKNGVVHEIDQIMVPLINMFDYISQLGDDHSMIRDSILSYNSRVFDRRNSTPVGVDPTGNTVYDSVFYTSNPLFEQADFSSEFSQYTLFLPNNQVVEATFDKLKDQYDLMGQVFGAEDSLMAMTWIKEAVFHEGIVEDYNERVDWVSPFGNVWRSTVQEVDTQSGRPLSNGYVFDVTDMKVPNNVIIDRIKSLVHYYGFADEAEKEAYYIFRGCTEIKVTQGDVSPVAGFYYWLMDVTGNPDSEEEFSVEFTPLNYDEATGEVSVVKVPPGEYNLYMGFRSLGHPYVDIYFSSGDAPIADGASPVATEIPAAQSTPWNYDRVNETDPNIRRWNGLGGLVGVVQVEGEEMSTFRIKVKFNKVMAIGAVKRMQIYHWTLKPTANNY